MYKLTFTDSFKEDIKSSVNYIKNTLQAPVAAENLKLEIKSAYKKIIKNPLIYPIVSNDYLASLGFRFIIVKNYMLFFTVNEKEVNIIRFLYGRRDWINILNNDE